MNKKNFNFTTGIIKANDAELQIRHLISTNTVDRYGDIVVPNGYLKYEEKYRKNPVVLFGHDSHSLVIGKNLELKVTDTGVMALTQFAKTEAGKEIYELNKNGFLNAWSIGFIPKVEEYKEHTDGKKRNFITEWELLEYSSVPVPANPDAVNLALKECKSEEISEILKKENEILLLRKDFLDLISEVKKDLSEIKNDNTLTKEDVGNLIKEALSGYDKIVAKKLTSIVKSLEYINSKK